MLTSIHYFSQYRDYALRTSSGRNNNFNGSLYNRAQTQRNAQESGVVSFTHAAPTVQLNKAYSSNVLSYIKSLGQNIITLKDASRLFVLDSGNMDFNAGGSLSFEGHLRWIDEDLRNFANSYNNLDYLSRRAGHNAQLGDFTHSIRNITRGHEPLLSHLGIITADEGGIAYHGIGHAATKEITRAAADAFRATYEASREFLAHPMTAHLQFKDLNYYYSYTIGDQPADAYKLIESGVLMDRWI